jgi:hypothetical protein
MKHISPSTEKRIKADLLFIIGLIWISYFAFYNPEAMNPYFMTLGGSALFGPAVIGLWRSEPANKDDYKEESSDDKPSVS